MYAVLLNYFTSSTGAWLPDDTTYEKCKSTKRLQPHMTHGWMSTGWTALMTAVTTPVSSPTLSTSLLLGTNILVCLPIVLLPELTWSQITISSEIAVKSSAVFNFFLWWRLNKCLMNVHLAKLAFVSAVTSKHFKPSNIVASILVMVMNFKYTV